MRQEKNDGDRDHVYNVKSSVELSLFFGRFTKISPKSCRLLVIIGEFCISFQK